MKIKLKMKLFKNKNKLILVVVCLFELCYYFVNLLKIVVGFVEINISDIYFCYIRFC